MTTNSEFEISISTVAFEGYEHALAFAEIAALGAKYVEPAYIRGYVEFDETAFSDNAAAKLARQMSDAGVAPLALSAHIDAGEPDAVELLRRRLGFAARIGARFVITNSTTVERSDVFRRNAGELARAAEDARVVVAFENPGHGTDNLFGAAADGLKLLSELNSPWLGINYDTGNVLTYSGEAIHPEDDVASILDAASHFHFKDILSTPLGWEFTALGEGSIDFSRILALIAKRSRRIPMGIELPLRLKRLGRAAPSRSPAPLELETIRSAVSGSLAFVRRSLAAAAQRSR
ncbi:MAG: sugar phosphate isomerase/epimerase [Tagaea sp.]|nr:sugar phosphate isomerase/epimerase [Tagaea sp.]